MQAISIKVLTDGTSGVYSKITRSIFEFKSVTIVNREIKKLQDNRTEYIFTISPQGAQSDLLAQELRSINGVVSVIPTIDLDGAAKNLIKAYPDIVGALNDISLSLDDGTRDETLALLGAKLGQQLISRNRVNQSGNTNQFLSTAVMPILAEFSICEARDNRVIISVCPFCRGQHADTSRCYFALGIIAGCFRSYPELKLKKITETHCIAMGHDTCEFTVTTQT